MIWTDAAAAPYCPSMDFLTALALQLALAALGFYVLYRVVRAAVLSALRSYRAEIASSRTFVTDSYLDADGR